MSTQADELRRLREEFEALPEIEKQEFYCRKREWDPELRRKAEAVINGLSGASFDVEKLEETEKIYEGYFHVAALRLGYEQIKSGGKATKAYKLKAVGGEGDPGLREVIEKLSKTNSDQRYEINVLRQSDLIYHKNFERLNKENMTLQDRVNELQTELEGCADQNEKLMLAKVQYNENFSVQELRSAAKNRGLKGAMTKRKDELIELLNM